MSYHAQRRTGLGQAGKVGGTLLAVAPATGPAAPFVAAAGAATKLFGAIFGRKGRQKKSAAATQEYYEFSSIDIVDAIKRGQITLEQGVNAIERLIQACKDAVRSFGGPGKRAAAHCEKTMREHIAVAKTYGKDTRGAEKVQYKKVEVLAKGTPIPAGARAVTGGAAGPLAALGLGLLAALFFEDRR